MTPGGIAATVARIEAEVVALREDFDQLTEIVKQQATIIRNFEDERQRRLGAAGTVKFIWGMVVTGVAGVAYVLHDVVVYFFPPRGH